MYVKNKKNGALKIFEIFNSFSIFYLYPYLLFPDLFLSNDILRGFVLELHPCLLVEHKGWQVYFLAVYSVGAFDSKIFQALSH